MVTTVICSDINKQNVLSKNENVKYNNNISGYTNIGKIHDLIVDNPSNMLPKHMKIINVVLNTRRI